MNIDKQKLDVLLSDICKAWNISGCAISIVGKDDTPYRCFFGKSDIEQNKPVTENTVFSVGSVTKSFTAALGAILQDKGILNLDKPIKAQLASFEMYDSCAEKNITIADFLNQNSGLPSHNLYWYGSYKNRQEIYANTKYLQNKWQFGKHWSYNNLNYLIAAAVMENLSGKTWETLVEEEIFKPLSLNSATFGKAGLLSAENRATGYKPAQNGEFKTVPPLDVVACGPAGCLNMNNNDLNTWARLYLNSGEMESTAVISKKGIKDILSPRCTNADMLPLDLKEAPYNLYGLGWVISPYRGVNVIYDGGNIEGFTSIVALLPQENIAITIQANLHEANLFLLNVLYSVIDELFFENDKREWDKTLMQIFEGYMKYAEASGKQKAEAFEQGRNTDLKQTLNLGDYVGMYVSQSYGELEIFMQGEGLAIRHNSDKEILKEEHTGVFLLSHYANDTFSTKLASLGSAFTALVEFTVQGEKVKCVSIPFEPLVDAIEFVKK